MQKFTHLHVHSHYSLLDGLPKIDELLNYVKELGMDSVAITDHGALYGAVEFYKKAKTAGVKPIIGAELYVALEGMRQERPGIDDKRYHLVLLAKNEEGYKNLVKLITKAHLEGFYYKPRIDEELLAQYASGLIASTACLQGKIPVLIMQRKLKEAEDLALKYQEIFGKDNFYLELQYHEHIPEQKKVNDVLIEISRKTGIPLIATNDVHYLKKEDAEAQDILMLINTGADQNDPERLSMIHDDFSLKSPREMFEHFREVPEAIENTQKIVEACNFQFELGKTKLPHFEVPNGKAPDDYLKKLTYERLEKKFPNPSPEIIKRIEYELSVIKQTGFAPYFLIVQDFVNWAKQNRIVVGPGRGSATGSLVSYVIGITNVDPIKYGLMFERFLNLERIAMPDIDLDFTDRRRDEVINYVAQKYGRDKVAQIITFGTMAARAVIRDVGRALKYTYSYCDQAAKMIPFGFTLDDTLKKVREFKNLYDTDEQAKRLIDFAKKLEGVARHASTHACGVVISAEPLENVVPLQHPTQDDQNIVTQYEMHAIEDLGLLKMDFLGLKNLTIIEDTLARVYVVQNKKIDIENLPLDDKETYKLLQEGKTAGVFQLECLSGDTIISNTTIKKLHERKNKKKLASVYLDEGKTHLNKIVDILESGEKEIYTLIAENNWYIKATRDHYFLTENGWKKLKDIEPGENVLVKTKAKHLIHNTCQTCGKQISGQKEGKSNFCYACSARFYRNPSKKASKEKIKEARLRFYQNGGKPWNYGITTENNEIWKKTAAKVAKAIKEKFGGRTYEEIYGTTKAKEIKKKMSKSVTGENNPMFGKPSPHHRGGFRKDLGHYVRSAWEADFARILRLHNLDYDYEPQTFKLIKPKGEVVHYTPDFYVKSQNTFYEIKGWFHDLDKEKIKLFQEQYPKHKFILISATKFAEFALKYKTLIRWECPRIPFQQSFRFIKVKEVKSSGREQTYDIIMQSPGNNFVANGFLVHNSGGMTRYLVELKPTEFEDIIAMISLFRPGPMELIPDYIARKHKRKKVEYLHPKMEQILKNTYGIMIYQEQLMQVAQQMAGFTLGEADVLRKAVGKKIKSLLEEQKEKLINGMTKNGIKKSIAEKIWEWVLPFASYGFNRCLSGDVKIQNSETGEIFTIKQLYQDRNLVKKTFSFNEKHKIFENKILDIINNGVKPVFEVITRNGRKLKATENHPFLTSNGWQILKNIRIGERIATPRSLPEPQIPIDIENCKLALLGYLLAEGNFCHPYGFYFYSSSKEEIKDYITNLEKFDNTIASIDNSKSAIAVYSKRKNKKISSEAVEWINNLGLRNKKATDKFFPQVVFQLSNKNLSILIGKMFQGDGCINLQKKGPEIFYATSSMQIASGLQHLLLRFGIISTIHFKKFKYRKTIKKGYTVSVSRFDNIYKFLKNFSLYFIGKKRTDSQTILRTHPIINKTLKEWSARGSKDTIPCNLVFPLISNAIAANVTISRRELATQNNFAERLLYEDERKIGFLRETVDFLSEKLQSQALKEISESDIYWDGITSVKPAGEEITYDLSMEKEHNFIANDIFVHNSHAAAYATIAYQTAYLKTHFPVEFMASLLTSEKADVERIAFLINETKKMGIEVLPPDINESLANFTVVPNQKKIRFGLTAIKNVGTGIVEAITQERKTNGPFKSIADFINRLASKDLNKKSFESLIKTGVFDRLAERNQLLSNMERLLEWSRDMQKTKSNGQKGLFDGGNSNFNHDINLLAAAPASNYDKLTWEKELLGLFVTSNPLEDYRKIFERKASPISTLKNHYSGQRVRIGGIISSVKKIITKKGRPMLFMSIEDLTDKTEVIVFPGIIERNPVVFQENKIVFVVGKVDHRDNMPKIICDEIEEITEQ